MAPPMASPAPPVEAQVHQAVADMRTEMPHSVAEVERLPPKLMLLIVGAALGILLGILDTLYELFWLSVFFGRLSGLTYFLTILRIPFVFIFSAILYYAYVRAKRNMPDGWIFAVIGGLLLMILGGWGWIGGLLGLIGGILLFLERERIIAAQAPPAYGAYPTAAPVAAPYPGPGVPPPAPVQPGQPMPPPSPPPQY